MERWWDIFFEKWKNLKSPPIFFKKNPWIFATFPHPWGYYCEALEERLQGSLLSMLKGRRIETQQGKALQTTVYIILVIYYVSVHVLLNVMCVLHVCMYIYIHTYWLSYLYIFNCDSYDMIVVWYSKSNYISGSGVYPEVDATADWGCGTALCAPAGRKVLMVRICSYQPWGFRHDFAHATVVSASNLKSLGGWRVCCQGESSIGAAVSIGCRRGGGAFVMGWWWWCLWSCLDFGNPWKSDKKPTAQDRFLLVAWRARHHPCCWCIETNPTTKTMGVTRVTKKNLNFPFFLRSHQKKKELQQIWGCWNSQAPRHQGTHQRDPPTTRRKKPSCLHPHLMQCHGPRRRPRSVSSLWVLCLGNKISFC